MVVVRQAAVVGVVAEVAGKKSHRAVAAAQIVRGLVSALVPALVAIPVVHFRVLRRSD